MRMLSGRLHWLMVGIALLLSADAFATKASGQVPMKPAGLAAQRQAEAMALGSGPQMQIGYPLGVHPGMSGVVPAAGNSYALRGPAPMDIALVGYGDASGSCAAGACGACGGSGRCGCGIGGNCGCGMGGNCSCGLGGHGSGGILGLGLLSGSGGGCGMCGGMGCPACGANGCLASGRLLGLLGPLAPYSEGGYGSQRWFDIYAGTIGLARTNDFSGFSSAQQDQTTGAFAVTDLVSTNGISGTQVLRTTDLDLDKIRYGLEAMVNLQTGPGTNLEARYFGLNNWNVSATANVVASGNPTLFSAFSLYGTTPNNGFDDTDRSFIHTLTYNSEIHNGEVNYRRRFMSPLQWSQGSWLMGVRYFDLDETFTFAATGSNNNTFTFDQLRFFDYATQTRNQLTGFQAGGDWWVNVVPGFQIGFEGKGGIFGNHAEVESRVVSNSIAGASEFLQDGKTAYLGEAVASLVYRINYSWSLKASYNLLYIENVALAPENLNVRDFSNALGGGAFTANRFPFLDVDGEVLYQGWSAGGEWLF